MIYTNVEKSEISLESERCGLQAKGSPDSGFLPHTCPSLPPLSGRTCGQYAFPTQVLGCCRAVFLGLLRYSLAFSPRAPGLAWAQDTLESPLCFCHGPGWLVDSRAPGDQGRPCPFLSPTALSHSLPPDWVLLGKISESPLFRLESCPSTFCPS